MRACMIILVAAILSLPLEARGADPDWTGTVSANAAEFSIPLAGPTNTRWNWYLNATSEDALEYQWGIRVRASDSEYEFGFLLFKFPGSSAATGSLEDLLKAGQATVWKNGSDGSSSAILDARVSVSARDGALLVRITDPAVVHRIFGGHPATARAVSKTPGAAETTREVAILYPGDKAPQPLSVSAASSDPVPGSDEHDAAVRQLIEVMGIGIGGKQIDAILKVLKKGSPAVPPVVWDDLRKQLATEEFTSLQVALFRKHFSLDEIRGLLAFYGSPLGQRYLQEQPGLMEDGMALGAELGRKAAEKLQHCIQQKGYTVG
jgi:hypothetical protein